MDAALWQRVQEVFADTIELPLEARPAHLVAACAGQSDLRAEVESLLQAHGRAGAFIEPVPDHIGKYRLEEEIAQGGMGTVYRATRDDGQFRHQVAVKILSLAATPSLYRRFLDEQQILANLSHANIARLLDGGITRSGLSYIVMEFIEGEPIDRYCESRPVHERLRLFRTVCAAVHHAHQNLIVHRDLKPANILVTADGVPKLLDFGIAKMLSPDQRRSDVTIVQAMTPEYASPEQVRGEPVSTASDVYSLGSILYELLTGRRPYRLDAKTYDEIRHAVCDLPIEKPATGSSDLDAIVSKAMRKEPADRYPSAEALSADIERYLSTRPVDARRGAKWYVLSRFVLRHRVAVATAAVVAGLLGAAVAMTLYQSRLAQRRFEAVRQLASSVMFDIHDAVTPLPGSTAVRKQIVSSALTHLDKVAGDAAGDADLHLELGNAYLRLGDVQGFQSQANLGDPTGALESYQKAYALLSSMSGRVTSEKATKTLATVCRHSAAVLAFARRNDDARRMSEESVALLEGLVARNPSDAYRTDLAGAYSTAADVTDSVDHRLKALAIFEELLTKAPNDANRQRDVALAHKYIAGPLVKVQEGDRALPHLRRAEELDAARVAASPQSREAQLDLSFDYSQNATFYLNRRQFEAALLNFRKALETRLRLAESDPTDARLRDRIVYAYSRIGMTSMLMRQPREALAAFEQARGVGEALLATEPRSPQYRSNVARSQQGIGNAESALGRRNAACAAWREGFRVYAGLDQDGKLREDERDDFEEMRTRVASCS
jgi:non-specific serine/threonine protein kinase/serine/threonine-protein kinase